MTPVLDQQSRRRHVAVPQPASSVAMRWLLPSLLAVALAALATPAQAQALSFDPDLLGGDFTGRLIQLFLLITVLSLAPGIMMMATCFPFMIIVLSILRQGLGVQQTPPNMMMVSLALFLTFFVMEPVFTVAWDQGVRPYVDGDITEEQAIERTVAPFREYMERRVAPDAAGVMLELAQARVDASGQMPLSALLPAYMITEIERGVPVRVSRLSALPGDRHRGRFDPHVDGHDDAAAGRDRPAVQAGILYRQRRMEPDCRRDGAQLRQLTGAARPVRLRGQLSRT